MSNPVPVAVRPYKLNVTYAATIVVVHLTGLFAVLPYCWSWIGFGFFIVGIHVFGKAITIGYHRLLTHRSFKTPKWVERCIAILAICSMQDTPARWVSVHRMHHVHSDEIPDPHSPKVNFWWSHVGWLMFLNRQTFSVATLEKFAKDLLRDPFYMRLETNPYLQFYYVLAQIPVYFAVGFGLSFFFSPELSAAVQLGTSLVVWGVYMRIIAVWHITWSVNSLSHLFGYRNYETQEDSRNNWFVALITVGEGWHNNHHEDPSAASVQHRWWEVDISYYEIKLLQRLGLASDIVPKRQQRHGAIRPAAAATVSDPVALTAAPRAAAESQTVAEAAA